MISATLLDDLLTHGRMALVGGLLILGGLALAATALYFATRALQSAYLQQGRRFSRCRLTGREVVSRLLAHVGLPSDGVEEGAKIDHYDQLRRRVKLRTESSVASSVAALAIAAHEVGHAEQFATGYWAARATRYLLLLLVFGAGALLIYPFATTIVGEGTVNLTSLATLFALMALLRLPVSMALEQDATRRGQRLLNETGLAHETEHEGIAHFLRAGFFVHIAFSVVLVMLISAGIGTMWLVENGLDTPTLAGVPVAPKSALEPGAPRPPMPAIDIGESFASPLAVVVAMATVWWSFFARARKKPARTAANANNEAMARFQTGDLAGAIALFDEALRQDPGLASAHYNRAVALTCQGRNPEALASIEALLACRTEDAEPLLCIADPWCIRGTLRLDQGDYQGAIDDLSRALDLDPAEPAMLLRNRGLAWIRLGNFDRALRDTDDALALAPEDAVAYNNRGAICLEQGNLEQAEADLRRAIAIDPQLPNPREHLAKLLDAESVAAAHPAIV